MTGGSERGKLEAEKKLMERVSPVVLPGGSSTLLALAAFSGMDRNDGIAYLKRMFSQPLPEQTKLCLPVGRPNEGILALPGKDIRRTVRPVRWMYSAILVTPFPFRSSSKPAK
jgi:hypothetical protein